MEIPSISLKHLLQFFSAVRNCSPIEEVVPPNLLESSKCYQISTFNFFLSFSGGNIFLRERQCNTLTNRTAVIIPYSNLSLSQHVCLMTRDALHCNQRL